MNDLLHSFFDVAFLLPVRISYSKTKYRASGLILTNVNKIIGNIHTSSLLYLNSNHIKIATFRCIDKLTKLNNLFSYQNNFDNH